MVKSVTPDAISIILSHPSPDSSTEIQEIVVQVVDLKPAGNTYMFTASDGKMKVKTILQSNLSSEVISGNIQNLGLICILDYTLNDSPTKNEKYLIVTKCETVSPALEAEIKTEVKSEETDPILKPKQEMVINSLSSAESNYVESCYSTSYLGDDTEPSFTPNLDRSLDKKVSKKQLKNKEKQIGAEALLNHHHWNQIMKVERQKAERHEKMFAQQEIALEQHRRQLEIEERQLEIKEMHNEMKIMETNTTGMDLISAAYWNNLKIEIMKKRGFNF